MVDVNEPLVKTCAKLLARCLREGEVDLEVVSSLRRLWPDATVVSVVAAVSPHEVLGTSSMLVEGSMRSSIVPVRGTAGGSAMLADEAAFFHQTDRPQRLEDLQCLNLRYRATSFLCVPVPRAVPEALNPAASPHGSPGSGDSGSADATALAASAAPLAAGCLTLGFAEGVRTSVLDPLVETNALAAALAPLLPEAATEAYRRHLAGQPAGSREAACGAQRSVSTWQNETAGPDGMRHSSPEKASLANSEWGGSGTDSDSATAAECAEMLAKGDSWLYQSSWGSFSSDRSGLAASPAWLAVSAPSRAVHDACGGAAASMAAAAAAVAQSRPDGMSGVSTTTSSSVCASASTDPFLQQPDVAMTSSCSSSTAGSSLEQLCSMSLDTHAGCGGISNGGEGSRRRKQKADWSSASTSSHSRASNSRKRTGGGGGLRRTDTQLLVDQVLGLLEEVAASVEAPLCGGGADPASTSSGCATGRRAVHEEVAYGLARAAGGMAVEGLTASGCTEAAAAILGSASPGGSSICTSSLPSLVSADSLCSTGSGAFAFTIDAMALGNWPLASSLHESPAKPPSLRLLGEGAEKANGDDSRDIANGGGGGGSNSDAELDKAIAAAEAVEVSAAAHAVEPAAAAEPRTAAAYQDAEIQAAMVDAGSWQQRAGLRFDDASTELRFVQWQGLQAQRTDQVALGVLLVMWVALGLPPMALFRLATPQWSMFALGALWLAAFCSARFATAWYVRHRETVLQIVLSASLAFGCCNKHAAVKVAADKLMTAVSLLHRASAYSWLNRAWLVEAMAVFPLLLMVRVRRQAAVQVAIFGMVVSTMPTTCATCVSPGTVATKACNIVGGCMLAVVGTAAPLAFMWRTERQSRATFQWRLGGKEGK